MQQTRYSISVNRYLASARGCDEAYAESVAFVLCAAVAEDMRHWTQLRPVIIAQEVSHHVYISHI